MVFLISHNIFYAQFEQGGCPRSLPVLKKWGKPRVATLSIQACLLRCYGKNLSQGIIGHLNGNIISLLAIGWYATKQVVPFQKTGRSWLITIYHQQLSAPIRISLGKYLILLLIKLQFWMYWWYKQNWNIVVQKYKSPIEKDASWVNGHGPCTDTRQMFVVVWGEH